ncbi:MAG: hypothetical protein GY861_05855 [bacterium]|nr:hypothetical protein [bacterium]
MDILEKYREIEEYVESGKVSPHEAGRLCDIIGLCEESDYIRLRMLSKHFQLNFTEGFLLGAGITLERAHVLCGYYANLFDGREVKVD